jgi:cytidine deaminase
VLYEFGGNDLVLDGPEGELTLGDLLPWAFGPDDVTARAGDGRS